MSEEPAEYTLNRTRYHVTLCSDGADVSDQLFTIELSTFNEIATFIKLVELGGIQAGLIKPVVNISGDGNKELSISERNGWRFTEEDFTTLI